jgi:cholesterol 7-dehydrogenase
LGSKVLCEVQHTLKVYGPGIQFFAIKTAIGNCAFLITITAINPYTSKIIVHILSPFYMGWFAKFSAWSFLMNIVRDKRIWDWKKSLDNPILLKEEKGIKMFRDWFSQFYTENSKTQEDAKNDLAW